MIEDLVSMCLFAIDDRGLLLHHLALFIAIVTRAFSRHLISGPNTAPLIHRFPAEIRGLINILISVLILIIIL